MYYNPQIAAVAGAIALSIAAPAFADSQLIASAGLTVEQAEGMTLTEIAQHKFNREESPNDRWDPSIPAVTATGSRSQLAASAGLAPEVARYRSLDELAVAMFNRNTRPSDQQIVVKQGSAVVATRSVNAATNAFGQLIASAGLTSAEAEGMSLAEIVQYKFDRNISESDRQTGFAH
jgi:hypothetical protein